MINKGIHRKYIITKLVLYLLSLSWLLFIQEAYDIPYFIVITAFIPIITSILALIIHTKEEMIYRRFFLVASLLEFIGITLMVIYTGSARSPLSVIYLVIFSGIGILWPTIQGLQYVVAAMFTYTIVVISTTSLVFKDDLIAVLILQIPTILMVYLLLYSISFAYSVEKSRREGLEYQLSEFKRSKARLKKAATEAEEKAHRDAMTGLYNHGYFQSELRTQLGYSYRYSTPTALLMCDIDKFKLLNDTYGHQFGDRVLTRIARIIVDSVRSHEDVVARYGGEEIAVILPQCTKEQAQSIAERIRRRVEMEKFYHDESQKAVSVTISIGVTESLGGESAESVIQRADEALYEAKNNGRNQIVVRGLISL